LKDFSEVLEKLPEEDKAAAKRAAARQASLTKPPGSLGKLEELAVWLAAWQNRDKPRLANIAITVFAGNHGVTRHGVSAFPSEVTDQMVANFRAGGAAINQLARLAKADLAVVPMADLRATADFTEAPALTKVEFWNALRIGIASVPEDADLFIPGDMGIGNTTSSAALAAGLFGGKGADWAGRGTGLDGKGVRKKSKAIDLALAHHADLAASPLDWLRRVGGHELAAIAGSIVGARLRLIPVILDGFVVTAAASTLFKTNAKALNHCIAGHNSAEAAHKRLLREIGLEPLLDLDMRLGEASGAVVAVGVLRAAVETHNGMVTFDEANVSGKLDEMEESRQ
jgi:nicotinate-nucleotide--dimethylbenzimidazole phosphoribosyltransferase